MSGRLVLYFSVYGTAKRMAEEIAFQTGADLLAIEPAVPYDNDRSHYNVLARRAKLEHDMQLRPIIQNTLSIAPYDEIFLGYPIWCDTVPMILLTLLEQADFSGKTVIPFNTHLGARDSGTWQLIREKLPQSQVLDGLVMEMHDVEASSSQAVSRWLGRLCLAKSA
ncbi:MAG: flavodoxin [Clostridia bacterium]|nr:flavodoxin [Clostridia bacterium]